MLRTVCGVVEQPDLLCLWIDFVRHRVVASEEGGEVVYKRDVPS